MPRVLIFVVAYNAESTLQAVVRRIPRWMFEEFDTEVLVIDDGSTDSTFEVGIQISEPFPGVPLKVLKNPTNLGYGGNQKLGYRYAIRERFDYVVLLHGDGQYAPEEMPRLLHAAIDGKADAVFGSRMLNSGEALKGGMPLYKYVGNRILTTFQNRVTGLNLSEWHSGYRLYSVAALKKIAFERNSNDFDFDTEIILQLRMAGCSIQEVAIPTYYGDEICHVNGIRYALQVVHATVMAGLSRLGIFHDEKYATQGSPYRSKFGYASSHQMALDAVQPGERLLILGCGPVETVAPFAEIADDTLLVDLEITGQHLLLSRNVLQADLNAIGEDDLGDQPFDTVLLLDVIEHLRDPAAFLSTLRKCRQLRNARFIVTTPNVVFAPIRVMFALGQFNYGPRGILDKTHTRLFTWGSLRRMVRQEGFDISAFRGIPGPFPLAFEHGWVSSLLLKLNSLAIALMPRTFSYQLFCEITPQATVENLLEAAETHSLELCELMTA